MAKSMSPKSLANLLPPWQPGESGNKKGKLPGSVSARSRLRKLAEIEVERAFPNAPMELKKVHVMDAVLLGLLKAGMRGDVSAAREIINSLDGLQKSTVELQGKGFSEIVAEAAARRKGKKGAGPTS